MTNRTMNNWMVGIVAVAALVAGGAATAQDAVIEGRDALRGDVEYPWYDADNDALRPVELPEPDDPESEEERPDIAPSSLDTSRGGAFGNIMNALFWLVIVVLFVGLAALLVWAFLRQDRDDALDDEARAVESSSDVDRIEQLPFTVRKPQGDLLEEARRCYERGDFHEAIIYLYSYKLVQLDKHHLIRLSKGKTNRQYLREVRPQPHVVPLLERTMIAFEDVFFGHHDIDRRRFETCWHALGEFHQILQGTAA